jgi:hypothetical protein
MDAIRDDLDERVEVERLEDRVAQSDAPVVGD